MDFAQRELEKYGWSKGQGLGKTQSGITEALKPKIKLNKGGIGLDIAKDHTDRWWERSFNNAASNLQIEVSEDEVAFKSSKKSDKKKRKDLYLGFIQKGTNLTSGAENAVDVEPEDEEILIPKLSDEELFKACGGRTSHKAARHGLNLSGKLARIEQQEAALSMAQTTTKTKRKNKVKHKDAKRKKEE